MTERTLFLHAWEWPPVVSVAVVAALSTHLARWRLSRPLRTAALLGAAAAVVLALMSPVAALARGTLFSAHMTQHMLLALIAPPLALLSLPPRSGQPSARRNPPAIAWGMGVAAMWIWHVPALCNAAATWGAVRAVQNVSLPILGAAFWWPIVGPRPEQRLGDVAAVTYLFTACVACTILGVSIALSPVAVCAAYGRAVDPIGALPFVRSAWGLTPAVDQQLGGLLMWVPGCTVYGAAILAVLARFYAAPHLEEAA